MCQLHWFRLVNFVHGVIASILIYDFVCMCPHVSVKLVSTGQLCPWGDSYSILIYEFVCICVLTCQLHWSTSSMGVIAYTIYILHYICVGNYSDFNLLFCRGENDLRDVAFMKPNETPAVHCTGISRNAK